MTMSAPKHIMTDDGRGSSDMLQTRILPQKVLPPSKRSDQRQQCLVGTGRKGVPIVGVVVYVHI